MKLLILTEQACDLSEVLQSCGADTTVMTFAQALTADISPYDAYCVIAAGKCMDARLRRRVEEENDKGKRVFLEAPGTYRWVYSADPVNTVRSRLIYLEPADGEGIPGLETGDLLDDESNLVMRPWCTMPDTVPVLVYRERIVAHDHTDMPREEVLENGILGLWFSGEHTLMTSFMLHNFNRARFAPRARWQAVICWIARWLTGSDPAVMPEPVVCYGVEGDLQDAQTFDECRRAAVERGMKWLDGFLVDAGCGGIREGLSHNVDADGVQAIAPTVRNDCTGEAAGAYEFYGYLHDDAGAAQTSRNLADFCFDLMQIKGGLFDGMMRWTETAWGVCYADDVARAILPQLYAARLLGRTQWLPQIEKALDFLVKTTARNGLRVSRTDCVAIPDEQALAAFAEKEAAPPSAHYNAWYAAALLLAWQCTGKVEYLDTARRGLESLMAVYPDTALEHSQTQEAARMILPLALLVEATGESAHREMLYRVAKDLQKRRHVCGGYQEWDENYAACFSRESTGECSLLTHNGDPVADLLYTCNWLPLGFAWAWYVTKDAWFYELWQDVVRFCIRAQNISESPLNDGSWCRAFDMERMEAYACPHDAGWAAYASESGWTNAEILMGMMLPDVLEKTGRA